MRKFTILLMLIPFFGFAQTFDFNNSDDGWNGLNGFTAETHETFYRLMTKPGDGTMKNPSVKNAEAGVNADEAHWVGITMKNTDENGPTYLRVSFPKDDGSGYVYKNIDISAGDTDYKTYWLDLTNSNWSGTENEVKLNFKKAGNTDYILPAEPVTIDIDRIKFASEPDATLQNAYYFDTDGDTEGFVAINGEISGPSGGKLTFTPHVNKYAKLAQDFHYVDATSNKYVHITIKNNSALNNQLRLISDGLEGTKTLEISVSDDSEKTYTFDLSGEPNWTGNQMFIVGIGSMETNKPQDAGTMEFYSIVFDNTVGISSKEAAEFSIYPNPANQYVTINSKKDISDVTLFDITGKQVMTVNKLTNNQMNISELKPGVYMVKVNFGQNNVATQRLIISR